jgi:hypothetical protein
MLSPSSRVRSQARTLSSSSFPRVFLGRKFNHRVNGYYYIVDLPVIDTFNRWDARCWPASVGARAVRLSYDPRVSFRGAFLI